MKHTPTPWRAVPASARPTGTDILCGSVRIATVSHANAGHAKHARLIAAAPDLYAALRAIAEAAEGNVPLLNEWVANRARAALAKVNALDIPDDFHTKD